jgi:glycerate kinase
MLSIGSGNGVLKLISRNSRRVLQGDASESSSGVREGFPTTPGPRLLIAPDSFKGTFSAAEVATALARGVVAAGATADSCPLADGGEGTAGVLAAALGGHRHRVRVHDPLGRLVEAELFLLEGGTVAALDVAAASGLPLLDPAELDPVAAGTYGTGELIAAAIEAGARTVLVAAGGSATSDGGRGAIEALRERGGAGDVRIEILCDVETLFEDAVVVFGPQKGADPATVRALTARLIAFAATLPRDPLGMPMGGAAGGLSGGLWATFGATLRPGAAYVLETLGFDARLTAADLAISGEGRLDFQSLRGKVVGTVAGRCRRAGRPLHVVVGRDDLEPQLVAELGAASIREASTLDALVAAGREIGAAALG